MSKKTILVYLLFFTFALKLIILFFFEEYKGNSIMPIPFSIVLSADAHINRNWYKLAISPTHRIVNR
jgi:hypothetical protein